MLEGQKAGVLLQLSAHQESMAPFPVQGPVATHSLTTSTTGSSAPSHRHMLAGQLGGTLLQLAVHQLAMLASPSQAPAPEHAEPAGGAWVGESVTGAGAVDDEVEVGVDAVGNVGFVTGLPAIEISEHALNVSCGPQPSPPVPSPHQPQLLPVV